MSVSDVFSDRTVDPSLSDVIRPLWTLGKDLSNDEKVLVWAKNCYMVEAKRHQKYREQVATNIDLYRGKHYANSSSQRAGYAESSSQGLAYKNPKVSKLVINYIAQGTQIRANLTLRNRPSVTINPVNSEYGDRISAKLVNYWVQYELWQTDFERAVAEFVLTAYTAGEAYLHTFWDPNRGQPMPAWSKAEAEAEESDQEPEMPATDSNGEPILGDDGQPLMIQKPVRAGDVAIRVLTPLNTLVQSGVRFDHAAYFIEETWEDIDEVKARYPDLADKIVPDKDLDTLEFRSAPQVDSNKILVCNLWHKSTEFLGRGRFISFTRTCVLENKPLPKGMTSLPLVRLTDIDTPGLTRGTSLINQARGVNGMVNDLASLIRRNAILTAHPKWLLPAGAKVKKEVIGNDITSIEYAGPTPPQMVAPPPVSQEVGALRREFRDEIYTIFRISENQQGKTMPNVRSALAQQQIDEADEQRANTDISKYQAAIRKTVERLLELAACFYEKGDPRLIPVVGKDKRYLLQSFDPKHLQKGFDVRVTNSTGMPQSKAAKIEALVALREQFGPTVVRDEQVVDMLEFGDSERYFDQAAVASRAAEAENEAFMSGETVAPPVAFENLIVHWTVHLRDMQNRGFKTDTPPHIRAEMVKHLMATEMLMLRACRRNPNYAVQITELPMFPTFYSPSTVDRMVLDRARLQQPMSLMEIMIAEQTGQLPPPAMAQPGGAPEKAKPASPAAGGIPAEMIPQEGEDAGPETAPSVK